MKSMNDLYRIEDDIYHADIWIMINFDADKANEYFKKNYHIDAGLKKNGQGVSFGQYFPLYCKDDSRVRHFICMGQFEWAVQDQVLLLHEIFHLVCRVLDEAGVSRYKETDEAYAYYQQYVTLNIFCEILKDGKLLKKIGLKKAKKNGKKK